MSDFLLKFAGQLEVVRRDGSVSNASIVNARSGLPMERRQLSRQLSRSLSNTSDFDGGGGDSRGAGSAGATFYSYGAGTTRLNSGGSATSMRPPSNSSVDALNLSDATSVAADHHHTFKAPLVADNSFSSAASQSSAASAAVATNTSTRVALNRPAALASAAGTAIVGGGSAPPRPNAASSRLGVGALHALLGAPTSSAISGRPPLSVAPAPAPRAVPIGVSVGVGARGMNSVEVDGAVGDVRTVSRSGVYSSRDGGPAVSRSQSPIGARSPVDVMPSPLSAIARAPENDDDDDDDAASDGVAEIDSRRPGHGGASVFYSRDVYSGGTWAGAAPTSRPDMSAGTWGGTMSAAPSRLHSSSSTVSHIASRAPTRAPAASQFIGSPVSRDAPLSGPAALVERASVAVRASEATDTPPRLPHQDAVSLGLDEWLSDTGTDAEPHQTRGGGGARKSPSYDSLSPHHLPAAPSIGPGDLHKYVPDHDHHASLSPTSPTSPVAPPSGAGVGGPPFHMPRIQVRRAESGGTLRRVQSARTEDAAPLSPTRSVRTLRSVRDGEFSSTSVNSYKYPSAAVVASVIGSASLAPGERKVGAGRLASTLKEHSHEMPRPGPSAAHAIALVIHENQGDSYAGLHGGPRPHAGFGTGSPTQPRATRDNETLVRGDADKLAFSKKPRHVAFTRAGARALRDDPRKGTEARAGDPNFTHGVRAPSWYYEFNGLGPEPDNPERAAKRAGREKSLKYAEEVKKAARAAAKAASEAALAAPLHTPKPAAPAPAEMDARTRALEYAASKVPRVAPKASAKTSPDSYAARKQEAEKARADEAAAVERGRTVVRDRSPLRAPATSARPTAVAAAAVAAKRPSGGVKQSNFDADAAAMASLIELEEEHERRREEMEAIRKDLLV